MPKRKKSDKKLKRLENKKRKIQALLKLIPDETEKKNEQVDEETNASEPSPSLEGLMKMARDIKQKLQQKVASGRPKFFLTDTNVRDYSHFRDLSLTAEENESMEVPEDGTDCLSLVEIQQLILACLLPPPKLSSPPTWCKVWKYNRASRVAIFVMDYENPDLEYCWFNDVVRFNYSSDLIEQLLNVPLSNRQLQKMQLKGNRHPLIENDSCSFSQLSEKISRTSLLLNEFQLEEEKYPSEKDSTFRPTKLKYSPVTDTSSIFSLDCEMCYTEANKLELARVSLVDEKWQVVYDTLVKPPNKIKNYLTRFSGITKNMLQSVNVTLEDVQEDLCRLLPDDAILCGQSLNCDLEALKLAHPYIIDTSVIYNLSGHPSMKSSLKLLAAKFLKMEIQNDEMNGHDSSEDALATMKLVQLKMSMGLEFGNRVLQKSCSSWNMATETMPLRSYLQRFDAKMCVFYDYFSDEEKNSFVIISDHKKIKYKEVISKVICTDKAICLVLTKQGLCFIKF